jgi:hypothetical protein
LFKIFFQKIDTSELKIGKTGKRKKRWKSKLNWRSKRPEKFRPWTRRKRRRRRKKKSNNLMFFIFILSDNGKKIRFQTKVPASQFFRSALCQRLGLLPYCWQSAIRQWAEVLGFVLSATPYSLRWTDQT